MSLFMSSCLLVDSLHRDTRVRSKAATYRCICNLLCEHTSGLVLIFDALGFDNRKGKALEMEFRALHCATSQLSFYFYLLF